MSAIMKELPPNGSCSAPQSSYHQASPDWLHDRESTVFERQAPGARPRWIPSTSRTWPLRKAADERRVAAASARAEGITAAVLAKAFRGELVPTEAELARREGRDYEPASVLLARIRAARAAETAAPKKPRPPRGGRAPQRAGK